MSDLVVLHETPDSKHGTRPEDRTIQERIRLGVAIVDKPAGPTSHQVSAWVRDMFSVPKAGHSGTLDPRVTGVLPVALADATRAVEADRKSTRLNSSHSQISYAVFCLKKKKKHSMRYRHTSNSDT